jgi:helix-turn-helix protein
VLMRRPDSVPHLPKYFRQVADVVLCQHATTRFGHEDQLGVQSVNDAPATPVVTTSCHRRMAGSDAVLVRYRYRLRPMPGQQQALARVFGCARVVFNDSLRLREECHEAGEKVSDTEIQCRVIALAKQAPERAWLAQAPLGCFGAGVQRRPPCVPELVRFDVW